MAKGGAIEASTSSLSNARFCRGARAAEPCGGTYAPAVIPHRVAHLTVTTSIEDNETNPAEGQLRQGQPGRNIGTA